MITKFRKRIISILSTGLCCALIASGLTLINAAAENVEIPTTELFANTSDITQTAEGLIIDIDEQTAALNGTIAGDLEVEYAYVQDNWGDFEFGFYDKDDPDTRVFSVYRGFGHNNNGQCAVIDYSTGTKKYYAVNVDLQITKIADQYTLWATGNGDDSMETLPGCYHSWDKPGKIVLSWTGDTVTVSVTIKKGEVTTEKVMATLTIPNFKDGYIMKVYDSDELRSSAVGGVKLLSINGMDLSKDKQVSESGESTRIEYKGEYEESGKNVILCGSNALNVFDLYGMFVVNGITVEAFDESFDGGVNIEALGVGEHERTISHKGVSKNYLIKVLPAYERTEIFTEESSAEHVTLANKDLSGVKVLPAASEAEFNGEFIGDMEIEYVYGNSTYGQVLFDFYSKADTINPAFSVYRGMGRSLMNDSNEYINEGSDGTWYVCWGSASVLYDGKFYSQSQAFDTALESIEYAERNNLNFYPANNTSADNWRSGNMDKWAIPGKIVVECSGDTVTVKLSVGTGNAVTGLVTMVTLNLPGFADGYTVRMHNGQSVLGGDDCHDPIVILSVNGTSFANEYVPYSYNPKDIEYQGVYDADSNTIRFVNKLINGFTYTKDGETVEVQGVDAWVQENYPGREILYTTFAYGDTRKPPVDDAGNLIDESCRPNEKLYIRYAYLACYYHALDDPECSLNSESYRYIGQWRDIHNHFLIWDYAADYHNYMIFPNDLGALKTSLKIYKDMGVSHYFREFASGANVYPFAKMRLYVCNSFFPSNTYSLRGISLGLSQAKKYGMNSVINTLWGDNGAECSVWSSLPCVVYFSYLARNKSMDEVKAHFKVLAGVDFDTFMQLEYPNTLMGKETRDPASPASNFLYNDLFSGQFDCYVTKEYTDTFKKCTKIFKTMDGGKFSYVVQTAQRLCEVLSIKSDMGIRLRKAYQSKDSETLQKIVREMQTLVRKIDALLDAVRTQWMRENKPNGLEVQEYRLGGLRERVKGCRAVLQAYLKGKRESIPELEIELLNDVLASCSPYRIFYNSFILSATSNVM